jgi:predicted dehydrogenase
MNVALIGLEGHWTVPIEGAEASDEIKLVAAWDYGSTDGLMRYLDSRGIAHKPKVYSCWREILDRGDIDIVCTNMYHNEQAQVLLECCKRGINILPEKPLTYGWHEYEQVREAVETSGVCISMLLTMRYEPTKRAAMEAVRSGAIGEVTMATAQKSYRQGDRPQWQRDSATFAGIIPFVGSHALDQIRWTTGLEIVEVMAYQGNIGRPEYRDMENQATVLALLENGASASATMDFCRPAAAETHGDDRTRVTGSEGVVESRSYGDYLEIVTHTEGTRRLAIPEVEPQFIDFVRSVRGEKRCEVAPEDVWRITEICLRARESAQTGRPVKV